MDRSTATNPHPLDAAARDGIACCESGCTRLTHEDARRIYDAAKASQAERMMRLPDENAAIRALFDGFVRLKEMGWRDASYAPKDGQRHAMELIEVGSTGIHRGYRDEHGFWIEADGDIWPSRPVLFREVPGA